MGNDTIPIKVWITAESAVLLNTLAEQHQQPFDRIIELALAVFHQQSSAQPVSASAFDSTSAIDRLSASLTELEHRIAVHLVAMRNDLDTFNSRLNMVEHSGAPMGMLAELDCRLRSVENMAGFSTTELGAASAGGDAGRVEPEMGLPRNG